MVWEIGWHVCTNMCGHKSLLEKFPTIQFCSSALTLQRGVPCIPALKINIPVVPSASKLWNPQCFHIVYNVHFIPSLATDLSCVTFWRAMHTCVNDKYPCSAFSLKAFGFYVSAIAWAVWRAFVWQGIFWWLWRFYYFFSGNPFPQVCAHNVHTLIVSRQIYLVLPTALELQTIFRKVKDIERNSDLLLAVQLTCTVHTEQEPRKHITQVIASNTSHNRPTLKDKVVWRVPWLLIFGELWPMQLL